MTNPHPNMVLYRSVGRRLFYDAFDAETAALAPSGFLDLPEPIEFVWRHPVKPLLYVACGHRGAEKRHLNHVLCVCSIDTESGAVRAVAQSRPLASRPIHLSLDARGEHVLVAYNDPSGLTVHRVEADGSAGEPMPTDQGVDTGIYAHHVRATPSGRHAILVTRGNSATDTTAEDPGALKVFDLGGGRVAQRASVAPHGGYGFGPRDIDFHPAQPWCFVSLERQSRLQLFRMRGDVPEAEPAFDVSTLADPLRPDRRQLAGTLRVHPNGRFLYVVNRADGVADWRGQRVFRGGENSIAVFSLDPVSGEPRLIQAEDTRSIHVRTFAIDPTGRWLVAASTREFPVRDRVNVVTQPAALTIFRIGQDGRLQFLRKDDVETRRDEEEQQWVGIVDIAAYGRGSAASS
jgi:6-phosphogluconolactonase (cycloisomerase 2 family)